MRNVTVILFYAALAVASVAHAATPAKRLAATFATELPFKDCDGLICIEAKLDGAPPRTLMLDTGNAHSTLITDVAKELSWTLEPIQQNGTNVRGITRGGEHRVQLGGVQGSEPFFVFDRDLLGEYKPPVDGSITYDFFKDRVLEIDYPHHRLRISNVIAGPSSDKPIGAGSLKLITFGDRGPPVVVAYPFTVNGKNVRAQLDTVFTGTLLVYDSALDALGLHKQGVPELIRYTDGGVNMLAGHADSIGFDKQSLPTHTLYFVGDGKNPVHQPDGLFEATAGNALFTHSIVTLDFHAMTIDVKTAD